MQTTFILGDRVINRLGFGAMRITGDGIWGPPEDRTNALNVLNRAVQLGVNFIDTADSYGPNVSEELIHEALFPYAGGLVIATKGGMTRSGPNKWAADGHPKHLRKAVEGSLKRLGVEQIELYQFHRPDTKVPFEESLQCLIDLQNEGLIKYIGLSNVTTEQLQIATNMTTIMSVQNSYSILNRESEDVLRMCEQHGIMFIPYFPIGGNTAGLQEQVLQSVADKHGATTRQIGLAWLLQHSEYMVPIPGTGSVAHLEENMRSLEIQLDTQDVERLNGLTE